MMQQTIEEEFDCGCGDCDYDWSISGVWESLACVNCGSIYQVGRAAGSLPSFVGGRWSPMSLAEQLEFLEHHPEFRKHADFSAPVWEQVSDLIEQRTWARTL